MFFGKKLTRIAAVAAAVVMTGALAGCGSSKTGTCEECGQTEKLTRFIEEDGTVHWLCNDCYRMAKMFGY